MDKVVIPVLAILLITMSLFGSSGPEITYRPIFTTGIQNELPIDNVDEISIDTERIYIFVYWYNLKAGKNYQYKCNIYDGEGFLIATSSMKFKPTDTSWNTWTWYYISSSVDKPGEWKFEIFLKNKKVFEKYLTVLPPDEINANGPTIPGSVGV